VAEWETTRRRDDEPIEIVDSRDSEGDGSRPDARNSRREG
jgi:hypothetical protein